MAATVCPPGPPSRFPGAHLLAFRRRALDFLCQVSQTCGDVASFRLGPERVVLLTHPEAVHAVLVTQHRAFSKARRGEVRSQLLGEGLLNTEGEVHQRHRRLVQPAFARQRLAQYAPVITAHGVRLRQQWQAGDTVDIAQTMARLTLTIAAHLLFRADLAAETPTLGAAITTLVRMSRRFTLPFAPWLTRLPLPSHVRARRAQAYLDATILRLIQEHRTQETPPGAAADVLSLLPTAHEGATALTEKQVRDQALTLLIAGHETTAVALTWTWYCLAQHPEVEATLHRELATVLDGRVPTAADLPHLPYTRQVFTEVLRLYPPAWMLTRRTLVVYTVGDYTLPPGTVLLLSPYVTQRDPRFFPAPEVFDP
jgi:cytochrome P450